MASLGDKVVEKAIDLIIYSFSGLVLFISDGLIGFGVIKDPFYHQGWLEENRAWIILFIVIIVLSFAAGFWMRTLLTLSGVIVICACIFGYFYGDSTSLAQQWQISLWVLHGIIFSMMPGFLSGWIIIVLKRLGVL